jgi:hypothetical protein
MPRSLHEPSPGSEALSLDHVGTITRDLAAAAARWERLGFRLAPVSRQRGAIPGQAGVHPWASANRCAVFRKGYLELIGIVDPHTFNPWERFLARFEGLHLLALRCENADHAYKRLAPEAPFLDPPIARDRALSYRGVQHVMRFRNIFSRDAQCPEGRYIVIEHQTPELLWQEELLEHENGAVGLEAVIVVTDDDAVARRVHALDSIPRHMTPAEFFGRFHHLPPAPSFAAITIAFTDLARTLALLQTRGVVVKQQGEDVWLAPEYTNGFVMRMIQHA